MSPMEILEVVKSAVTILAGASTLGKNLTEARKDAQEKANEVANSLSHAQTESSKRAADLGAAVTRLAAAHASQLKSIADQALVLVNNPRLTQPEKEKEQRRLAHEALHQINSLGSFLQANGVKVEDLKAYFEAVLQT